MRIWLQNLWQHCRIAADEAATRSFRVLGCSSQLLRPTPSLQLSNLEPRILFSATPIDPAMLPGAEESSMVVEVDSQDSAAALDSDATSIATLAEPSTPAAREIVLIDAAVPNIQQLLDDLSASERDVEVFVLEADRDGLDQITAILESRSDISSIHIVSHAENGTVKLGNLWLSESNLAGYAGQIASWQSVLTSDADILLYGCDLAENAGGRTLIDSISALTGADVAASDDTTGHATYGGNWQLEYETGTIDTSVAFSSDLQQSWFGKLATFTVTNTNDSGAGSLRQAIINANGSAGADTIEFNIPITDSRRFYYQNDFAAGTLTNIAATSTPDGSITDFDPDYPGAKFTWFSIQLSSALPAITEQVTIDGFTQAGASANTMATGNDAVMRIEIDGSSAGGSAHGLYISGGSNTIVRGLVINGFSEDAVEVSSTSGVKIEGNFIGTNVVGTATIGNSGSGIYLLNAADTTIGGTAPQSRNVVSGNSFGAVNIEGAGSTGIAVQGNYIGTNAAGTSGLLGNGFNGIWIANGASNNTVGGTAAGAGNVVSGHSEEGIEIQGSGSTGNVIQGNSIGTNAAGTAAVGNVRNGIAIENAVGTIIGGTAAGAGNLIGGNSDAGILLAGSLASGNVVQGNFIGTDSGGTLNLSNFSSGIHFANSFEGASGGARNNTIGGTTAGAGNLIAWNVGNGVKISSSTATGNALLGNRIFANTGIGIDLAANGVTTNDPGDVDSGANRLQNFPVLSSANASSGTVTITGNFNSTSSGGRDYRIEFFASSAADASGNGEGQRYLGFSNVTTDLSGNATINAMLAASVVSGEFISATATDVITNDTSEFAQNIVAVFVAPDVTLPAAPLSYTIGDPLKKIDSTATVTDPNSADFDSGTLTVSITANDSADDRLEIVDGGIIQLSGNIVQWKSGGPAIAIGTFAGGTDGSTPLVVTLNANATVARTQDLLRAIGYRNVSVTAPSYSVTAQFVLTDGDGGTSDTESKAINISGANQPPENSVPGPQSTPVNTPLTFSTANGNLISTSDPDAGASTVEVTLTATNGTLTLNNGGGLANAVGNEVLTNLTTTNAQTEPAVASASNGNYVVVWSGYRNAPNPNEILFQLYDANGATIGNQTVANSTTANIQSQPDVAMDGNGNFVIVWTSLGQDNADGKNGIYAQRFDASGNPVGGEFLVNTVTADQQSVPAVAMDADGDFVVVWEDKVLDGANEGVFGQRFNSSGATVGGQFQVNLTTFQRQGNPDVAMDAAGNFVVVWDSAGQDSGDGQAGVYSRRFDINGNPLSGEILVNTTTLRAQDFPSIAMNAGGKYVITWTSKDNDGSGRGIFGQLFDSNGDPIGPTEFQVNSTVAFDQINSSVTMDASGNFSVVWESDGVYLQQFDSSGNPIGSERAVNTTGAGTQDQPAVAMDADGDFVVVWHGNGTGDTDGIFQRRYQNATEVLFTAGDGVADTTMTFTGLLAEANALIDGMIFTPTTNFVGAATVSISVNDLGNTGPGGAKSDSDVVNITVVNNMPPSITSDGGGANAAINVTENTTVVTTVTATDADLPAQTLTFTIVGGADAPKFSINSSTGALSFLAAPNFETPTDAGANNVYDVTVRVSDGSLSDTQAIAVTVLDVNAIVLDQFNSVSYGGNNGNQAWSNNWTEGGEPGSPALGVLQISGSGYMQLGGNAAVLTGKSLTRQANLSGATQATLLFDYQRVDIAGGGGSVTAQVSSNGGASWTSLQTYSLSAFDGGFVSTQFDISAFASSNTQVRFLGSGLTSAYFLADNVQIEHDGNASNTAPVITSNGGGASAVVNVAENATAVTTVTATDSDVPAQSLTFSISGGADAAKFSIDNSSGTLAFITAPDYESPTDAGGNNIYDVVVQVNDGNGGLDAQSISVTVDPVNESPMVAVNAGTTVAEGSTANLITTSMLDASDPDDSGSGLTYEITSLTSNGTLRLSGAALGLNDTFTQDDIDNNRITYDHNGSEITNDSFEFSLADGGENGSTAATGTFNITVNPVNDAPSIGAGSLASIAQNDFNSTGATISSLFNASFSDPDISSSLSGIVVVGNTANALTEGSWQYSSNGANWFDIGTVDDSGLGLAIAATSSVRFVPVLNFNGTPTSLTIRGVDDSYSGSFSTTGVSESRQTINTSSPTPTSSFSNATTTLGTSVTANTAPTIGGTAGHAINDDDTATPLTTVTINDAEGDSVTVVVTLSGGDANGQFTAASLVSSGFVKTGSGQYTLALGTTAAAQTAIRSLVFTPTENQVSVGSTVTTTFTINVNDGSPSSNSGTTVVATSVNDAPTLADAALAASLEDDFAPAGATVSDLFSGSFSDPDASSSLSGIVVVGNTANETTQGSWQYSSDGTNWFNIAVVDDAGNGLAIAANSKLRFVPVANFNGSPSDLTVRGLDDTFSGSFSTTNAGQNRQTVNTSSPSGDSPISNATAQLATSVLPVNDQPTLADHSTVTTSGTALVSSAGVFAGLSNDIDGDLLTAVLISGPSNGSLVLAADGSFTYTPNAGFVGTDSFLWKAFDGTTDSAAANVQIQVNAGLVVIPGLPTPPPVGSGTPDDPDEENDDSSEEEGDEADLITDALPGLEGGQRNSATPPLATSEIIVAMAATHEFDSSALLRDSLLHNAINDSADDTNYHESSQAADSTRQQQKSDANAAVSAAVSANYLLMTRPGAMWNELDQQRNQLESHIQGDLIVVGAAGAAASSFTVGVVAWALRTGFLASGLLAQMPAWRAVDPLLVMQGLGQSDDDDETLEELMKRQSRSLDQSAL